jgi:putative endonuclease
MHGSYYVYILLCHDGSHYVGSTQDVAERVATHSAGLGSAFTAKRRPVTLVYTEKHPDRASAMRRERQLKRWSHQKRDALIEGDNAKLKQLSKRRS